MASSLAGFIAVAIVMVSCARAADAQGTEPSDGVNPCAMPLPALQIEKRLEPTRPEVRRRSLAFPRPLAPLANVPGLLVTVRVRPLQTSSNAQARTRFAR